MKLTVFIYIDYVIRLLLLQLQDRYQVGIIVVKIFGILQNIHHWKLAECWRDDKDDRYSSGRMRRSVINVLDEIVV